MRITPSTMPNPARRIGTKASFLPEITLVLATATGVSISTSFKGGRELLIAHEHPDFSYQFPEFFGAGVFIPHNGQLVLNQRMIHT